MNRLQIAIVLITVSTAISIAGDGLPTLAADIVSFTGTVPVTVEELEVIPCRGTCPDASLQNRS
jgi:hypothetical protein